MTTTRDMSMTLTARATKTINETAIEIWLFFCIASVIRLFLYI